MADYLVATHAFQTLHLARTASTPPVEKSATQAPLPEHDHANGCQGAEDATFPTADALLDFVTTRWSQRWVTTDIWDESVLNSLQRRPFFILVSVDAPVSIRWERFAKKYVSPGPCPNLHI